MSAANKLNRIVSKLNLLPAPVRSRTISLLLGKMVPYVGTSRVRIEEMTEERVTVLVPNRRRNRNHIGGVHAAAMALAAETATGFVVGMNVPDSKILVIKSMKVDFKKRTTGALRATATLSREQREQIRAEDGGEVEVSVAATDSSGREPILCEMVWAWRPRRS
jgi:acyl-coenzyme A thioesterase PaaI-like protein